MASEVVNAVVNAVDSVAPNVPAVEVAAAAVSTAADPSPSNILADIELVVGLVKQLKVALAGKHPSLLEIVKAIF